MQQPFLKAIPVSWAALGCLCPAAGHCELLLKDRKGWAAQGARRPGLSTRGITELGKCKVPSINPAYLAPGRGGSSADQEWGAVSLTVSDLGKPRAAGTAGRSQGQTPKLGEEPRLPGQLGLDVWQWWRGLHRPGISPKALHPHPCRGAGAGSPLAPVTMEGEAGRLESDCWELGWQGQVWT